MSTVMDVRDEIAALLEPTQSKRDDSGSKPVEFAADTLYAWPRTGRYQEEGDGTFDQVDFSIRVAWATDASIEHAGGLRDRGTSDAIQAKAEAFAAAFRGARTGANYSDAQVSFDYESLVTNSVRGFYMDVVGWVITS